MFSKKILSKVVLAFIIGSTINGGSVQKSLFKGLTRVIAPRADVYRPLYYRPGVDESTANLDFSLSPEVGIDGSRQWTYAKEYAAKVMRNLEKERKGLFYKTLQLKNEARRSVKKFQQSVNSKQLLDLGISSIGKANQWANFNGPYLADQAFQRGPFIVEQPQVSSAEGGKDSQCNVDHDHSGQSASKAKPVGESEAVESRTSKFALAFMFVREALLKAKARAQEMVKTIKIDTKQVWEHLKQRFFEKKKSTTEKVGNLSEAKPKTEIIEKVQQFNQFIDPKYPELLGVKRTVSLKGLKKAFMAKRLKLIISFGHDREKKLNQLKRAYEVLRDSDFYYYEKRDIVDSIEMGEVEQARLKFFTNYKIENMTLEKLLEEPSFQDLKPQDSSSLYTKYLALQIIKRSRDYHLDNNSGTIFKVKLNSTGNIVSLIRFAGLRFDYTGVCSEKEYFQRNLLRTEFLIRFVIHKGKVYERIRLPGYATSGFESKKDTLVLVPDLTAREIPDLLEMSKEQQNLVLSKSFKTVSQKRFFDDGFDWYAIEMTDGSSFKLISTETIIGLFKELKLAAEDDLKYDKLNDFEKKALVRAVRVTGRSAKEITPDSLVQKFTAKIIAKELEDIFMPKLKKAAEALKKLGLAAGKKIGYDKLSKEEKDCFDQAVEFLGIDLSSVWPQNFISASFLRDVKDSFEDSLSSIIGVLNE